jgi:Spx/MgsR family transcriptional regulator
MGAKDKLRIYSYAGCSTCRKALAFVAERGVDAEVIDITATPPSLPELKAMLAHVGQLKKLFNTSGQVYREQKIGEKLATLDDAAALALLAANGRLVKRPFLMRGSEPLAVGFKSEEWIGLVR